MACLDQLNTDLLVFIRADAKLFSGVVLGFSLSLTSVAAALIFTVVVKAGLGRKDCVEPISDALSHHGRDQTCVHLA